MTSERKVLFIHNGPLYTSDDKNFYGVSFSDDLKQRFLKLGNSVTFVMRKRIVSDIELDRFSKIENKQFNFIETPDIMGLRKRFLYSDHVNKIIAEEIKRHDIVICRLPSKNGSIGVKYALQYDKPLMVEFVACGWDALWNYNWKGKLLAPYAFIKQRIRMKKVPFVVYVTDHFLQNRYPTNGRSTHISNVNIPLFPEKVLEKRLDKINRKRDSSPLILGTVGNLDVPYKSQHEILRVIYSLKKQGIVFRYRLLGGGKGTHLKKFIKQYKLEEEVELMGSLPHDRVFQFFDDIDIYVHPSKQEGLPRAMIEALSRGCPTIGARTGGIPELIPSDYIFSKGDLKGMERKLLLISQRDKMLEAAKRNFHLAKEYSNTTLQNKRLAFYDEFLSHYNLH